MSNTVNVAIVVGLMVFFTLGTAFIVTSSGEEENSGLDINVIAAVNLDGSGIFADRELSITPSTPAEKDAWRGLVIMTPGPGSIQHYMFNKFVDEYLPELTFSKWAGGTPASERIYWMQVAPMNMKNTLASADGSVINGGFPWEPFLSDITESTGMQLIARTNDIEPGHPCCMVAAKESFLKNSEGATRLFLTAYMEAVDWLNAALADRTSNDYKLLVTITKNFCNLTSDSAISKAFDGLTYTYDFKDDLEEYVANLIVDFEALGLITKHVNDPAAFANSFINRKYIDQVKAEPSEPTAKKIRIRVGHLAGDVHQIALMVGVERGIFAKYGLELVRTLCANGPEVMRMFQLGVIDIGFLGLPPAVLNTANFR